MVCLFQSSLDVSLGTRGGEMRNFLVFSGVFQSSLDVSLGTRNTIMAATASLMLVSIVLGRLSWYSRSLAIGFGLLFGVFQSSLDVSLGTRCGGSYVGGFVRHAFQSSLDVSLGTRD